MKASPLQSETQTRRRVRRPVPAGGPRTCGGRSHRHPRATAEQRSRERRPGEGGNSAGSARVGPAAHKVPAVSTAATKRSAAPPKAREEKGRSSNAAEGLTRRRPLCSRSRDGGSAGGAAASAEPARATGPPACRGGHARGSEAALGSSQNHENESGYFFRQKKYGRISGGGTGPEQKSEPKGKRREAGECAPARRWHVAPRSGEQGPPGVASE